MKKYFVLLLIVVLAGCDQPVEVKEEPKAYVYVEPGNDIITVGDSYHAKRCYYIDINQVQHRMVVVSNTLDQHTVGDYLVTYEYTDTNGTTHQCERKVWVVDDVAPVVTLRPGIDTIKVGEEFIDQHITAEDNYSDNLTVSVEGDVVDNGVPGTYTINYVVTDEYGNTTTVSRVVTVIE